MVNKSRSIFAKDSSDGAKVGAGKDLPLVFGIVPVRPFHRLHALHGVCFLYMTEQAQES